jgi:murein DD-endopeptidase MepM/ murein hydrolase activator NlpD
MKVILGAALAGAAVLSHVAKAQAGPNLEIRFCPAARVHSWPLESHRGIQSLVMQNALIINRGATPADLVDVDVELLEAGGAIDRRRLAGADLARAAAAGPSLQTSGRMKMLAFQFCGTRMIETGVTLAGPTLAPGQALLLVQQPFAYKGKRDALRVLAHARTADRDVEASASLPISSEGSRTVFRLPLQGVWFAAVGPTMHTGHRWALPEEFAYDFARLGDGGLSHRGDGARFEDYYAYGAPVLAAADGVVVAVVNDQPQDIAVLRRPGESAGAYGARQEETQSALLARGPAAIAGNHVMIDHGNGEYSLYAHLQPGGGVRVGDRIKAGAPLGRLGSSGNATEPHLHFQVCDAPDPLACAGIPIQFQGVELPYADYPRPLQSGDVVVAN